MLNDDNIAGLMLELGAANALGVYVMLLLQWRTKDNYEASVSYTHLDVYKRQRE